MSPENGSSAPALSIRLADLTPTERYKILCGVVVPRPIAWVTTANPQGLVNAAPFSFFNVFSEDPALVVLGLQHHADGRLKDTTRNIHASGQFVVNMCDEALALAMNDTAIDFPAHTSEPSAIGLSLVDSVQVQVPRIALAPFALECRRHASMVFGPGRELMVGEVLQVHARAGLMDPERFHIDYEKYEPVGRLFADLYTRQGDVFSMTRETVAQFEARAPTDAASSGKDYQ